jgi:hypothetical protein
MLVALTSVFVILLDIALTGAVIEVDYQQRVQERVDIMKLVNKQDEGKEGKEGKDEYTVGQVGRRWTSGVGEILWDIEGRINHRD